MTASRQRLAWVIVTFGLLAGLIGLDSWRGGPASTLSRCNLALSRSSGAPADVLVVGSSRLGTAVDPVALEAMLGAEPGSGGPTAERLALGRSPLRANVALVENYLTNRGDPAVIVLELSFLTGRTVDRLATVDPGLPADAFLFRRDLNLMGYRQIITMPAVAMPFTERETAGNRLRYAMRGAVSRSGALTYQFARRPLTGFSLEGCDRQAWTREPNWPGDFAFAWDESDRTGRPMERIEALRAEAARGAAGRPQGWQVGTAIDRSAPYDLGQRYRAGELALLDRAVELAADRDIPVVLLPLPVRGRHIAVEDVELLDSRFAGRAGVFDLYGTAGVDLSAFWYDDAHLQVAIAGELTTALLAQHLVDGALDGDRPGGSAG